MSALSPSSSSGNSAGHWQAPSVEQLQSALPQYEILEMLGRGGMGAVYKARQKSLNRLVAIKILPLGAADDELKFMERFRNEAETMARLSHPAIVSVHDFGETAEGWLYFAMEFVDGTDVQRLLQGGGRLSANRALTIAAHVCDALHYAHSRGVIHRDIKPANILIDQDGHVKVADFGLAKMNDPSLTSGLTSSRLAMGTPDYVAPEALTPGMMADHRADIYAVGVMLYQMLTGKVPRGMFKLPSERDAAVDVRFDAIVCKAMEDERDDRYQTAMDLRRDLDAIRTTPLARDDGTGPLRTSMSSPQAGAVRSPQPASVTPPSSSLMKWIATAAIFAFLGVGGFLIFSGQKPVASSRTTVPSGSTSSTADDGRSPAETWTDWLGPKFGTGELSGSGWIEEPGGFSTDREITGAQILPSSTRDCAVRLVFDLRGSNGLGITVRDRGGDRGGAAAREHYVVDATVDSIYLGRMIPGGGVPQFVNKKYPPEMRGPGERTLEFRCVGSELTATLDGTLTVTARDSALTEGFAAIFLKKGVLLKKVEIRVLDEKR